MSKRIFSLILCFVMVFSIPLCQVFADSSVICYLSDDFESYPVGMGLYEENWSLINDDALNGGTIVVDRTEENNHGAFIMRSTDENGWPTAPVPTVSLAKVNVTNKLLVISGRFMNIDGVAKMQLSLTDNAGNIAELYTYQDGEISAYNADEQKQVLYSGIKHKVWHTIQAVLDYDNMTVDVYVDGVKSDKTLNLFRNLTSRENMTLKFSVANKENTVNLKGRYFIDDVIVYTSDEIVEDVSTLKAKVDGAHNILLGKSFNLVETNEKPAGFLTENATVTVEEYPAANNKSAKVSLNNGRISVRFKNYYTVSESFTVTSQLYFKDGMEPFKLFATDSNGKSEDLCDVTPTAPLSQLIVYVDKLNNKVTATLNDTELTTYPITLKNVERIGFRADSKATFNIGNIKAFRGSEILNDSFFGEYEYHAKTAVSAKETAVKLLANKMSVVMSVDFNTALVNGTREKMPKGSPVTLNGSVYVPAEFSLKVMGAEIVAVDETSITAKIAGKEVTFKDELLTESHELYMSAADLAAAFGKVLSWDKDELVAIGDEVIFTEADETSGLLENHLFYERPTAAEVRAELANKGNIHPVVWTNSLGLAKVKQNIENYPLMQTWYESIQKQTNDIWNNATVKYEKPDGVRLLGVSESVTKVVKLCGFMYKMTKDTKYADRAWRDLEAAAKFPDWNPSHFLDVGEMSLAFGLAYDWFYDYYTDAQKKILVEGFEKNAMKDYISQQQSKAWWTTSRTNWCSWTNANVMLAILSMSEQLGEDANLALEFGFRNLEVMMPEFYPAGAWAEGTQYWDKTVNNLANLITTLENGTEREWGYYNLPGMSSTGYYPDAMTGAGGVFNYGDNTSTRENSVSIYWMANKFGDTGLAQMRTNNIQKYSLGVEVRDLLWYDPSVVAELPNKKPDVLYQTGGIDYVTMRANWTDPNALFVAVKSGLPSESHQHFDSGVFIFDAWGQRFAKELGRDGYTLTTGNQGPYSKHDIAYKIRSEGHNTITINPDEGPGHIKEGNTKVVKYESKSRGGYAVIDMKNAFDEVREGYRAVKIFDERRKIMVQDEFKLTEPGEAYWFMHTDADIELVNDGKTAILENGGQLVRADIIGDYDIKFEVMDPVPLPTTPILEGQTPPRNVKKLAVHVTNVMEFTIPVCFTPILTAEEEVKLPEFAPIAEWSIPDGDLPEEPKITNILINDVPLEGFSNINKSYAVNLPFDTTEKAKLTIASSDKKIKYEIIEHQGIVGRTTINVWNEDYPDYVVTYLLDFTVLPYFGAPEGMKEVEIVNLVASQIPEPENVPANVLDNNFNTRWAAQYECDLVMELAEPTDITAVGFAYWNGHQRQQYYKISVSEDGKDWKVVFDGLSSGTSQLLETRLTEAENIKYVKFDGNGTTTGDWTSILEARVFTRE